MGRQVSVIVSTRGTVVALAAKSATSTIPIVFALGTDPVELGLVASLNRPGTTLTGVTFLAQELTAKRVELLHELLPAVTTVALLVNPTTNPATDLQIKEAELAARLLGVRLVILRASTATEIDAAFASLDEKRVGALVVGADALFLGRRDELIALAARHGVSAIYPGREFVAIGGLMSYGADFSAVFRLAGTYAGRILKGEKPADLPVQRSTRIEMVLNLRTAKALGIELPTATLLRATDVIE